MQPRIGVIGTGWWATRVHIPSLLSYEECRLVALADSDPQRLAAASTHFGIEQTYSSAEEMLAAGGIDGVVVAVPHHQHHEVARTAMEHGVHVLVEKPLALRAIDAWDLVRSAERHRLHLLVGFTHQYTATARRCRDAIQSGEVGELLLVSGEYDSVTQVFYRGEVDAYAGVFREAVSWPLSNTYSDPSIAGGGQGQTQLSHAVGMVMWTTGQRADEVFAFMDNHDLDVDVVTSLAARLQGGTILSLASTGTLRPGQPVRKELRYYGTDGHLLQDLHNGTLQIHRGDGTSETVEADDGIEPAARPARFLVDLIDGRGVNPAPGPASAHAVECLEAAYRSPTLGRSVFIHELEDSSAVDPRVSARSD